MQQAQNQYQESLEKITANLDAFDADFDTRSEALLDAALNDPIVGLAKLKEPFTPVELNMDPGSAIGVNGEFLQPNPWQMSERALSSSPADWGDSIGIGFL